MRVLHLFGAVSQPEIMYFVRNECDIRNEDEIEKIMTDWRLASARFEDLTSTSSDLPESVVTQDIPEDYSSQLTNITMDPLFRNSFSIHPYSFKLVDLEKIVAGQRYVNLDYMEKLEKAIPSDPTLEFLIDFCLKKGPMPPTVSRLPNNPAMYTFKSESRDFRFLGGYPKEISETDKVLCTGGGEPVSSLILFFGYGSPALNVFEVGRRLILYNGFHRIVALMKKGIKNAPMVIQHITNWNLELPPNIAGIPREYLVSTVRPSLAKDFLNDNLTKELVMNDRERVVQVQWGVNQTDVPK